MEENSGQRFKRQKCIMGRTGQIHKLKTNAVNILGQYPPEDGMK